MRRFTCIALLCILLAGCLPQTPPSATPAPAIQPFTPVPTDVMRVNAWTNNPTPASGEQVIVYASLIKYHTLLGGIMMQATWADASHTPGTPNCFVLVTYGRGVCTIETGDFPPGQYVPVQIKFQYRGATYTGSTGFTPR